MYAFDPLERPSVGLRSREWTAMAQRVAAAIPRLRPGSPPPIPEQDYNSLMIAPLLRKLLLDEQPLVQIVNRRIRLRLFFPFDHWPLISGE